ncbi:MAG: electron transfer flavoprotein subunit alpha/FixB family protein [Peptococcaceae bacterium]|nr:electron transfer flavoprotein subunit alpha/FixB family protein [Peptococcaceae bacterium]
MESKNSVMILAEVRGRNIHPITYELLAWGRKLADQIQSPVDCAVLGIEVVDPEKLFRYGADRVLSVNAGKVPQFLATPLAGLLVWLLREEGPGIVIAAATAYGRTLMPIAAARLSTGLTADCTELNIDPRDKTLLQTRPAIGGNVMATIKTPTARPQMATVRPRSIRPVKPDSSRRGEVVMKQYGIEPESWPERFISFTPDKSGDIDLESAELVITGGKGMKSKENFRRLEELAGMLGAGLGATRNAVEAGWAPFSRQIGLTGKTVAPKVYIAVGVSGKIQHLAGMITSEYIIAINEDPGAQIFKVADLGIIGHAPAMVEKLMRAVREYKQQPGREV